MTTETDKTIYVDVTLSNITLLCLITFLFLTIIYLFSFY